MVKHTLPQTVECAEKHAEFMSENYHEVLEKLDELKDILGEFYNIYVRIVGPAIDKLVQNIYDIKILLYRYTKTSDIALLERVLEIIRETRVATRNVRKMYQQIKEKLFDILADHISTFAEEVRDDNIKKLVDKVKATIIEIKFGRRNLYALESHLTDLQKHIVHEIYKARKKEEDKEKVKQPVNNK